MLIILRSLLWQQSGDATAVLSGVQVTAAVGEFATGQQLWGGAPRHDTPHYEPWQPTLSHPHWSAPRPAKSAAPAEPLSAVAQLQGIEATAQCDDLIAQAGARSMAQAVESSMVQTGKITARANARGRARRAEVADIKTGKISCKSVRNPSDEELLLIIAMSA